MLIHKTDNPNVILLNELDDKNTKGGYGEVLTTTITSKEKSSGKEVSHLENRMWFTSGTIKKNKSTTVFVFGANEAHMKKRDYHGGSGMAEETANNRNVVPINSMSYSGTVEQIESYHNCILYILIQFIMEGGKVLFPVTTNSKGEIVSTIGTGFGKNQPLSKPAQKFALDLQNTLQALPEVKENPDKMVNFHHNMDELDKTKPAEYAALAAKIMSNVLDSKKQIELKSGGAVDLKSIQMQLSGENVKFTPNEKVNIAGNEKNKKKTPPSSSFVNKDDGKMLPPTHNKALSPIPQANPPAIKKKVENPSDDTEKEKIGLINKLKELVRAEMYRYITFKYNGVQAELWYSNGDGELSFTPNSESRATKQRIEDLTAEKLKEMCEVVNTEKLNNKVEKQEILSKLYNLVKASQHKKISFQYGGKFSSLLFVDNKFVFTVIQHQEYIPVDNLTISTLREIYKNVETKTKQSLEQNIKEALNAYAEDEILIFNSIENDNKKPPKMTHEITRGTKEPIFTINLTNSSRCYEEEKLEKYIDEINNAVLQRNNKRAHKIPEIEHKIIALLLSIGAYNNIYQTEFSFTNLKDNEEFKNIFKTLFRAHTGHDVIMNEKLQTELRYISKSIQRCAYGKLDTVVGKSYGEKKVGAASWRVAKCLLGLGKFRETAKKVSGLLTSK